MSEAEFPEYPERYYMRLPITAAIPYFYRWKVLQLRLMLRDLKLLQEHYNIYNAGVLYDKVCNDAEEMLAQLAKEIDETRRVRAKYVEKEAPVP